MTNKSVGYSREGDVFHYRWAARRCLRLLDPKTELTSIVIEGSHEPDKAGEYVIDVSEYSASSSGHTSIDYYQLKHTTVRGNAATKLGEMKKTLAGFADRFRQHDKKNKNLVSISFNIITNRKADKTVKDQLKKFGQGIAVESGFLRYLETYTKLKGKQLQRFCALLNINDGEGNYKIQNLELRVELSQLVAGAVTDAQAHALTTLMEEKVLSDSNHIVNREEVLKRFGITDRRDLFPAPPKWEKIDEVIERQLFSDLISSIRKSNDPIIIEAAGGVGKSVFSRYLISGVPEYSLTIAYDCFGAGSYRNRSSFRHRYRDALVQISNELATKGLCQPLLVFDTTLDDDIARSFLQRLYAAIKVLKKVNPLAQLFVVIDAADNAEMAAEDNGESCFAHELLREPIPAGCKLIMLCRPERTHLLKPGENIIKLKLEPFSQTESLQHLQDHYPDASANDGLEFHRLTGGNPRVQANALATTYQTITELLTSFGRKPITVQMQIEKQLQAAVARIKEHHTSNFQDSINAICIGLASLPPHIPITVLASAAGVSTDAITSFVADLGRPLWISDSSLQFRDEPTETWFRETFRANKENHLDYIRRLEPLTIDSPYVAEVLPQLYLQAGEYDKLIEIALSDNLLPHNNPIDARNVRIFRLRFAFIAALKLKKIKDAVKLSMRAGEEVAGSSRQFSLFRKNLDLLALLQGKEKVQEIAFKTKLQSGWAGSENIYTASLLSNIPEYKGEARGYLRAADSWLSIHFKSRKTEEDEYDHEQKVTDQDILEFAYAHLNIHGPEGSAAFLMHLTPKESVSEVIAMFARRLIDAGSMNNLYQLAEIFKEEPYYIIPIAHELLQVGKFLKPAIAARCLDKLSNPQTRIPRPKDYFQSDRDVESIISFIEGCFHLKLSSKKIAATLNYYVPARATNRVVSKHSSTERLVFVKALALRLTVDRKTEIQIEEIIPTELLARKKMPDHNNDLREYKECINGLLPWLLLRAEILGGFSGVFQDKFDSAKASSQSARTQRYGQYDRLPQEVAETVSTILVLGNDTVVAECYQYLKSSGNDFDWRNRQNLLRAAYRSEHLTQICDSLEQTTHELVVSVTEQGPGEIAEKYISISRAVAINSIKDAGFYFNQAVEIVSKFGDELVRRWEALESIAEQAAKMPGVTDECAYRFFRCAELVGNYVSREKYWSRNNAARVDSRLSSATALAGISRWRDRDIGSYQFQLLVVVKDLLERNLISPKCAWSLTHFFVHRLSGDVALLCIERESTEDGKQAILNDAVRILQIEGAKQKDVLDLQKLAEKYSLSNTELMGLADFFARTDETEEAPENYIFLKKRNEVPNRKHDKLFDGIQIDSVEGLTEVLARFDKDPKDKPEHSRVRDILLEALARVKPGQVFSFIDALLVMDQVEVYDATAALFAIPDSWRNRPSLKAAWPNIITKFGRYHAHELTNEYTFDSVVSELQLSDSLIGELKQGMFQGLQNANILNNEETFFGFCRLSASTLSPVEALELADYGMCRFELHMDDTVGDGPYGSRLVVDPDINKTIAGFIWSALGSPWNWERWNAVHAVRSMIELGCIQVIDELFDFLEKGEVGPYGSAEYVFYKLHAIQYLFIALARTSLTAPGLLLKHVDEIINYALVGDHILIQRFATETSLNIDKSFPGTFDPATLDLLYKVGKSPFKPRKEKYGYTTDSIWHKSKRVAPKKSLHFSFDFDQYWFEPLGRVFGVTGRQVEDIAAEVVINDWKMGDKNGYKNDPRVGLWNRSSVERETWHDHGSYPKTDNLDFYISYHAMLVAAAKLLKEMPVVETDEYTEDPWKDWLKRHTLSLEDGRWLSDIRDPLPLNRPDWTKNEMTDTWQNNITEKDFRNGLLESINGEIWITVGGGWHEKVRVQKEGTTIRSAFVARGTSESLMRALQTCEDHADYKLPYYEETDMEFTFQSFTLKGWLEYPSKSKGLDQFDPRSAEVSHPLISVGESVMADLQIVGKCNRWMEFGKMEEIMLCENWSTDVVDRDEDTDQCGLRLKANMNFLMRACKYYHSNLIIEMSIRRDIIVSRMGGSNKYGKSFVKILLISEDGTIKTTEGSFGIGQIASEGTQP